MPVPVKPNRRRNYRPRPFDLVAAIMAYEADELSDEKALELFQHLVDSGQAWSLQGSYGRTARALIDCGAIRERRAS